MILLCKQNWRAPDTGSEYVAGNRYDVRDARGEQLVAKSQGALEQIGVPMPPEPPAPNPEREVTATPAEGPERPSAPDRRARGGRARG